ncbi:TPM domain-containing protein [Dongia sp.]|jgi:putative membrane protein|uniref:TPM domain-containing protein n=1 Tax=Dongia sp. TaxID=1977262 RepID=UPI0034A558F4
MISEQARQRIEAAIASVEQQSRAELVAVIARRAGEYRVTGLALATIGAFLAGFLAWLLLPWSSTGDVLLAEFAVFLVLLALLELTPLGDRLTPAYLKTEAAQSLARTVFLNEGLTDTEERNAVLFFVSLAEHHVEIIADRAIHGRVTPDEWQAIVDAFSRAVRAGNVEVGYQGAITSLGAILATHFPSDGKPRNELGNRLIQL